MKVAVSIPESLFEEAERVARRLEIPRSRLYSRALRSFVRHQSGEEITVRMDAALERIGDTKDPGWQDLGLEVVRREKW